MRTKENFWARLCPKLPQYYIQIMTMVLLCGCMVMPAFAVDDMWTVARRCLKIGNVPNGEGFFRQTKPIFLGILGVFQGKLEKYGGKRATGWV